MSNHENTATEKRDVYATVTAQIITAIENGVGNWTHTFSPTFFVDGVSTVMLGAAPDPAGSARSQMLRP